MICYLPVIPFISLHGKDINYLPFRPDSKNSANGIIALDWASTFDWIKSDDVLPILAELCWVRSLLAEAHQDGLALFKVISD